MLRPRYRSGRSTAGVTPATDLRSAVSVHEPQAAQVANHWQRNVGERRQVAEQPFRLAILRHQHGSLGAGVAGRTDRTRAPSIAIVPALAGERPIKVRNSADWPWPSSPATPSIRRAPAQNSRGPAPGQRVHRRADVAPRPLDRRSATGECLDRRAAGHTGEYVPIAHRRDIAVQHLATVAEDDVASAETANLVELVSDIEDRTPPSTRCQ